MSVKKAVYQLSRAVPFGLAARLCRRHFVFPFYHVVSDEKLPHIRQLYPVVTTSRFRDDLRFWLQNFQPAALPEVIDLISGGAPSGGKPRFFLTFDDGLREMADLVAPLLQEFGVPAAFFVNPAFLDNRRLFYRHKISLLLEKLPAFSAAARHAVALKLGQEDASEKLLESVLRKLTWRDEALIDAVAAIGQVDFDGFLTSQKPYLTSEQVKTLRQQGFVIGSHSYDHPLFSELSDEERAAQVEESFRFFEEKLEISERIFAFPFTDDGVQAAFIRSLREQHGVAVSFGTAGLKDDVFPFHLQRIAMENPSFYSAREMIRAEYLYHFARSLAGKNKIGRP